MRDRLSRLRRLMDRLNRRHFGGRLRPPGLALSPRLRVTAGLAEYRDWTVRLSTFYHDRFGWGREARDTLLHEMIHLWLRQRGRPSGHTPEFRALARALGCPRFARRVPDRRLLDYTCAHCGLKVSYRRRVRLACRACCDRLNGGRFTVRFLLVLETATAVA